MREYRVRVNGNEYNVQIEEVGGAIGNVTATPSPVPTSTPSPAKSSTTASTGAAEKVTSPLPGVILDVAVKEGDRVKKGDKIVVLEAMKMENIIEATSDGVIKEIKVKKSDSVQEGDVIAIIG